MPKNKDIKESKKESKKELIIKNKKPIIELLRPKIKFRTHDVTVDFNKDYIH